MRNFQTNIVERIKTHVQYFNIIPKIVPYMR